MIPRHKANDTGSDLFDDARAFVTRAHRDWSGVASIEVVHIAMAEPTCDISNQYLVGFRLIHLDIDDLISTGTFKQHRCT